MVVLRYSVQLRYIDGDFGVQVFDPEVGEYRPRDVFSGGTEDQFLLAIRLAFALALMPEV
jgi:exonuclease SbcC